MKPNEYRCEGCGGVFEKVLTDEEAFMESIQVFGQDVIVANIDDLATICGDCYEEYMKHNNSKQHN